MPFTKINLKWIVDLNVKVSSKRKQKILEWAKNVFDRTQKSKIIKEKI